MYFIGDEHERNWKALIVRYGAHKDWEYRTACYAMAVPEIYDHVNWHNSSNEDSPVAWYFGDLDDHTGRYKESAITGQLSSGYRAPARAAVELFTDRSHYFELTSITNMDGDVFRVFQQALVIRRGG